MKKLDKKELFNFFSNAARTDGKGNYWVLYDEILFKSNCPGMLFKQLKEYVFNNIHPEVSKFVRFLNKLEVLEGKKINKL